MFEIFGNFSWLIIATIASALIAGWLDSKSVGK
jgi:hypothetical protein